ncbi:MAG: hypothetical protein ABSF55_00115 [Candidatus Staskawiczbacteria bacterium]|jgi:hypothetical protein
MSENLRNNENPTERTEPADFFPEEVPAVEKQDKALEKETKKKDEEEILRLQKEIAIQYNETAENGEDNIKTPEPKILEQKPSPASRIIGKVKSWFSEFFTIKSQEKIQDNKKAEKFLTPVFKPFFVDSNHDNEFSIRPGGGEGFVEIKTTARANDKEPDDFNADFSVGIETYARPVILDGGSAGLECIYAQFTVGNKKIEFWDIVPPGIELFIGGTGYDFNYKINRAYDGNESHTWITEERVRVNRFASPYDFVAVLHEVGHAINDHKKLAKDWIDESCTMADAPFILGQKQEALIVQSERDAWAEAIKIARKNGLSIEKYIMKIAQDSLSTYQKFVDEGNNFTGKNVEVGYTNERRRKMRRAGKNLKEFKK